MKELIKKIFVEHDFTPPEQRGNAFFFEKKNGEKIEYFLVDFIDVNNLKGYIESDSGTNVFTLFEDNKKKKKDVEKNTSLVLCIRVDNIKDSIGAIKNDILAIEENDYWFKKYTIIYTNKSIPTASDTLSQIDQFNKLLLDSNVFKEYKNDIYLNEGYFLIIQLFLKLPFLIVPKQHQVNYRTITEIVKEQLSEKEIGFMEKLRILEEIYAPGYWESIKSSSLDTSGTEEIFQEFMRKFRLDA